MLLFSARVVSGRVPRGTLLRGNYSHQPLGPEVCVLRLLGINERFAVAQFGFMAEA